MSTAKMPQAERTPVAMPAWAKLIALSAHFFDASRLLNDLLKNSPELLSDIRLGQDPVDWEWLRDVLDCEANPTYRLMRGKCPNAQSCFFENLMANEDAFHKNPEARKTYVEQSLESFRECGADTTYLEELCK